jgi:hypothetical protein
MLELQFPQGSGPALGYGVDALVIDGRVHGIKWFTRGVAQQELVFASLKEKFGEPAEYALEMKQNGFGAQFKSIRASWMLPGTITVVYEGVGSSIKQGSVATMSELARTAVLKEVSKGKSPTPM